jgi:hypothetical protein
MKAESETQARVLLAVGTLPGVRVFRNTIGEGWSGKRVQGPKDLVILRNASYVTWGLCPGSHDLIGWKSVVVTPEMIGQRLAIFLGGEIKTDAGKLSSEQRNFHRNLLEAGGISGIWRNPDEALKTIS